MHANAIFHKYQNIADFQSNGVMSANGILVKCLKCYEHKNTAYDECVIYKTGHQLLWWPYVCDRDNTLMKVITSRCNHEKYDIHM